MVEFNVATKSSSEQNTLTKMLKQFWILLTVYIKLIS